MMEGSALDLARLVGMEERRRSLLPRILRVLEENDDEEERSRVGVKIGFACSGFLKDFMMATLMKSIPHPIKVVHSEAGITAVVVDLSVMDETKREEPSTDVVAARNVLEVVAPRSMLVMSAEPNHADSRSDRYGEGKKGRREAIRRLPRNQRRKKENWRKFKNGKGR